MDTTLVSPGLPNCFVVGAARCGTTTIYRYLLDHPDAFVPAERKELGWFSSAVGRVDDFALYCRLFEPGKGKGARIDVSPQYLYSENAAALIRNTCGSEVRIVIIIRNPVDAARSLWHFQTSHGHEKLDLLSAIEAEESRKKNPIGLSGWPANYYYIDRYRYAPQIKRFINVFGVKQVRIFVFEKFFSGQDGWSDLADFLQLDGRRIPFPIRTRHNPSGQSRNAALARMLANPPMTLRLAGRAFLSDTMRWRIARTLEEWNLLPKVRSVFSIEQHVAVRQLFAKDITETSELIDSDLNAIWR
jgi:Sulfotransferase domain